MHSIIQENKHTDWQPDTTATHCKKCASAFTWWTRKHHCRLCGFVFCNECTKYRAYFPDFLKSNIIKRADWDLKGAAHKFVETGNYARRVCFNCQNTIIELKRIDTLIFVFDQLKLTIKDVKIMACVCKDWKKYADYYTENFNKALTTTNFENIQRQILWNNRFLFNHDNLIRQLALSVDFYKYDEILLLLSGRAYGSKKTNCKNFGCSKACSNQTNYISQENLLLLLSSTILSDKIHAFALNHLRIEKHIVPYLIEEGIKSPYSIIHEWLLSKCTDLVIANEVYWYIRSHTHNQIDEGESYFSNESGVSPNTRGAILIPSRSSNLSEQVLKTNSSQPQKTEYFREIKQSKYRMILLKWKQIVSEKNKTIIAKSAKLVNFLEKLYMFQDGEQKKQYIKQLKKWDEIVLAHDIKLKNLVFKDAVFKNSASTPILLTFTCNETTIKALYKPSDLLKDQACLNMIRIMDNIFMSEIGNFYIEKYNILPTSQQGGFIEIVEAETLYGIYKKKQSLLNFIIDKNAETNIKKIREIFIRSAAAYTGFSYVLGLSDRHPDNIMITNTGRLLEIDYEYLLGQDPKGITDLRISEEIVDAMGGQNSENFETFKSYCTNIIYNTMRNHIQIITQMLLLLPYQETDIKKFINNKLMPGSDNNHATVVFYKKLSGSYKYKLLDLYHSSSKDGTLKKMDNLKNYVLSYF